ncbi:MAG: hypothetical protein PHN44_10825 [Candidatus Marinimicrobia bacterium]|jgi:hypothetical protein|nr:hypothetical protein [Candidatus Neomarinimicrobiota bacterium]MDD5539917.1 hypothetical protein [Candidatus Neomarinimicrobiota bacterium]
MNKTNKIKFLCVKREGRISIFGQSFGYGDTAEFTPQQVLSEAFESVRGDFRRKNVVPENKTAMQIVTEPAIIEVHTKPENAISLTDSTEDAPGDSGNADGETLREIAVVDEPVVKPVRKSRSRNK